jgi:hypothetical protein
MGHANKPTRGCYQADEEVGEALKILLQTSADIHRRDANGQTTCRRAQRPERNPSLPGGK